MTAQRDFVLIKGSNGEIGRALCQSLVNSDYKVIAVTRQDYSDVFKHFEHSELIQNVVITDLGKKDDIEFALKSIDFKEVKSLNLVYSAAVFERVADFRNVSEDVWDRALTVNLKHAYLWNQLIAMHALLHSKKSSIVNITSQAWLTGGYGEVIAYASSKGGLVSMTKSLARILATSNVRVNCVAPGFIDTKSMRGNLEPLEIEKFLEKVPMARFGTVIEVAHAIEFLLSNKASYITGTTIPVTGGQIMP
jgi:NAD(P)-dependent dehydrogenase (short-subunit alcohol dehydrogenase family)